MLAYIPFLIRLFIRFSSSFQSPPASGASGGLSGSFSRVGDFFAPRQSAPRPDKSSSAVIPAGMGLIQKTRTRPSSHFAGENIVQGQGMAEYAQDYEMTLQ